MRHHIEMLPFFIYAALLYLAMVLVFTFPSPRGSMLHSATALLPFLAVGAPPGIDAAVEWVARRRRTWHAGQAALVFRAGFIILAMFLYMQGVSGSVADGSSDIPLWNLRDVEYHDVARWLNANARAEDIVMAVDLPSFYNVSHRRSIAIPTESVDAVSQAGRRYGVRYLILQFDHPKPLSDLYERVMIPDLQQVAAFRDGAGKPAALFEVQL